jgi:thiamine biosynthesis protein ThiS|tara:strand:+ start:12809 stop:13015 length:207 start_codon:yes stop_codon:yes gene_type:complete
MTITIKLNGKDHKLPQDQTIADLIKDLAIDINKVAIEKDLEIILPQNYTKTNINNGCQIEIVHFIGGG